MTQPGVGFSEAEGLMLVAEEAVEIRVLRRQGKSIHEIARTLDVSRNTVRRYLRRIGLPLAREEHDESGDRPTRRGHEKNGHGVPASDLD